MGVDWRAHKMDPEKLDKKVNSLLRQLGFLKTYDDGSAGLDYDKVQKMPSYEAGKAANVSEGLLWMNQIAHRGMSYGGLSNLVKQLENVKAPKYLLDIIDRSEGFVEKDMCKMVANDLRKCGKKFTLTLGGDCAVGWTEAANEIAAVFDVGAKNIGVSIS